jgi:hypothetical protein
MYHRKNLDKLKLLDANTQEPMKAFWKFDRAATAEGSPARYWQLLALAVALVTQCPYCPELQAGRAGAVGALRAGVVITHGTHVMDGCQQSEELRP